MNTTRLFAAAAIALAAVSAALGLLDSTRAIAPFAISAALVTLLASAHVSGLARERRARAAESAGRQPRLSPFKHQLAIHLVSIALYVLVLTLVLVELLALPAAFGALKVFGDFAFGFFDVYAVILAGFITAFAAGVLVAQGAILRDRAEERPTGATGLQWTGAAFAGLFTLAGIAAAIGLLAPAGIKPERAVFLLGGALPPAFLFLRGRAGLPNLSTSNDWFEHEEDLKRSGALRAFTYAFSALVAIFTGVAIVAGIGLLPRILGLLALAVATVLLVPTTFSVGVSRFLEQLEEGENLAELRQKRRVILNTLSIGLTAVLTTLGVATFFAFLGQVAGAPVFRALLEVFVVSYTAIFGFVILALTGVVIVRTRVPSPVEYTERLKSATILSAGFSFILLFFGVFIGAGFAQGTGIEIENAVLALAGSTIAITVFVKSRALLPSTWGLFKDAIKRSEDADVEVREDIRRKMMFTYLAGLLFFLGAAGFMVAKSLGVVDPPEGPATDASYFMFILVGIGIAILVGMRFIQGRSMDPRWQKQKKQEDIGKRRLTAAELTRNLVLGVSISLAVVLAVVGALIRASVLHHIGGMEIHVKYATDFFVFALLVGFGPYSYFYTREERRIQGINAKFPEFLRDLAESQRAGMTLTQAVVTASKGDYGMLTAEIRKMAAQIEWGVSFSEALRRFSKRVRTPLIERSTNLIIQAANSGGNVVDVLTAAADDARDIQLILKERKSSMSIYVMIIYVAFFVFIGVIAILNSQFIPEVSKAVQKADGVNIGGLQFRAFDEQDFKTIFFHAAVIQGFGGGLVAGVMDGGKPVSGLKHAFIMICLSYVTFRFMMGA